MNIGKNKLSIVTACIILSILIFTGYVLLNFKKITGTKTVEVVSSEIPAGEQAIDEVENANPAEEAGINEEAEELIDTTVSKEDEEAVEENKETEEPKDTSTNISIANKYVSWGYASASGRNIDTIIIHSSYDALGSDPYSLTGLLNEYKQYGVAPHYLIDRKGTIYRLVSDSNIAYHAGESQTPDGRTSVNNFSIGIELMNTEDDKFTDSQYDSLNGLLRYLSSKYKIKYTLGHSQIAPGRKNDPWNFSWSRISAD